MTLGEYHYRLNRGRIIIPPRLRDVFRDGVKFHLMDRACIIGLPSKAGVPMDGRGRVTLPSDLRKKAQIGDAVVVLFLDDHDFVAIYREESWELLVGDELKRLARYAKEEYCGECAHYDCLWGRCTLEGWRTRPLSFCTKFKRLAKKSKGAKG